MSARREEGLPASGHGSGGSHGIAGQGKLPSPGPAARPALYCWSYGVQAARPVHGVQVRWVHVRRWEYRVYRPSRLVTVQRVP